MSKKNTKTGAKNKAAKETIDFGKPGKAQKPAEEPTTAIAVVEDEDTGLAVVDPAVFETVETEGDAKGEGRSRTPWIGFFGSKTKTGRDPLVAAGVEVDRFYLMDDGPQRLQPFEVHLLKYRRFFTKQDAGGKVIAASPVTSKVLYANKYREHLVCLVAAVVPGTDGRDTQVPATLKLRGGLADALTVPLEVASGKAADPAVWAARSKEHAIAAQAKWPGGRFRVAIWGKTEKITGDEEGNTFYKGFSSISPTPVSGVPLFNTLVKEEYAAKVAPAFKSFERLCKWFEERFPKETSAA